MDVGRPSVTVGSAIPWWSPGLYKSGRATWAVSVQVSSLLWAVDVPAVSNPRELLWILCIRTVGCTREPKLLCQSALKQHSEDPPPGLSSGLHVCNRTPTCPFPRT